MASKRNSSRTFSPPSQRQNARHTPFSIRKLITVVFVLASSGSALIAESRPRPVGSISQRGSVPEDQWLNVDLQVRSDHSSQKATSSTSLSFRISGTATPVSTPTASTVTSSSTAASSFTGLPQPFDTPLGNNFTSTTCPGLFKKVIADPAVRNCVPISLLIQGSLSFFDLESSDTGLSKTLDISCNAISATCNELFQSYAASIASPSGCRADLEQQNQEVQFLFNGLISYLPIYNSACLRVSAKSLSASTNKTDYCFVSAVENIDNPADLSLYTLPLGLALSNSSTPTCSSCTQKTMSIFANAARNLTSPLSTNYISAAAVINRGCGANFVNTTFDPIAGSDTLSGAISLRVGKMTTLTLVFTIGAFILL